MSTRQRLAFLICPELRDEIEALRSGNTKVVLENSRLMEERDGVVAHEDCLNCRCRAEERCK